MEQNEKTQGNYTEQMVSFAKTMKENSQGMYEILKQDNEVIHTRNLCHMLFLCISKDVTTQNGV